MAKAFSMKGSESKKLRLRVAQLAQSCSYCIYLNHKNKEWHHSPLLSGGVLTTTPCSYICCIEKEKKKNPKKRE